MYSCRYNVQLTLDWCLASLSRSASVGLADIDPLPTTVGANTVTRLVRGILLAVL